MARAPDHAFLGAGWSFPPRFSRTAAGVAMVTDIEDIRESLHILLSTNRGERVMVPAYGCDLRRLVFRSLTTTLMTQIGGLVEQAIVLWEPRIEVLSVRVTADTADRNLVLVDIAFEVRRTNVRNNLVYPFYLTEATLTQGGP